MTASTPTRLGRPRRQRGLRLGLVVVISCLLVTFTCVLDYFFAIARPQTRDQVWLSDLLTSGYPTWFAGPALLAVVAMVLLVAAEWRVRASIVEPVLVLITFSYSLATRMSPMTGDQPAWLHYAGSPLTPSTEPLSAAVYKAVYALSGGTTLALQLVAPVSGIVALATLLPLVRRLAENLLVDVNIARAFIFATPFTFWYVTGYIENTFLALPALFLTMSAMMRWSDRDHGLLDLVLVGAGLGLTATLHGEFLVLVPFAGLWTLTTTTRPSLVAWRDLAIATAAGLGVVASVLLLLRAGGLTIVTGAASGGYDGQILTPFETRPNDSLSRFSMVSHGHLIQLDNIVVAAAPLIVLCLPVLIGLRSRRGGWRRNVRPALENPTVQWLGWLSLGYLGFTALWGFDFGMVGDIDLMLTMDIPFALLVLGLTARLLVGRPRLLIVLVIGSAWLNIAFYSLKVGTTWSP